MHGNVRRAGRASSKNLQCRKVRNSRKDAGGPRSDGLHSGACDAYAYVACSILIVFRYDVDLFDYCAESF